MSLAAAIFQRFDDPAAEARYRRESREAQVKFVRALMLIGPAMIASYILINPLFVEPSYGAGMLLVSLAMLPLIGFYYWYVGRPTYAANRWIDVAFFVAVAAVQYFFIRYLWLSGVSGWPFYAILCYNQMLLVTYACLAFAAAVRQFVIWACLSVAYVVIALILLKVPTGVAVYTSTFYAPFAGLVAYINWAIDDKSRRLYDVGLKLDAEKQKSEALLFNVLPESVAQRLQSGEAVADAFDEVTIVFVDIVGFTRMSQAMDAGQVVALLNAYFHKADAGCDLFGIEKVKTIGDAYMAVAGAIVPTPRPAKAVVDFARYLIGVTGEIGRQFAIDFKLHIGINTGPVVGGVIAGKKMLYDYWGDAINVASRLEGAAPANGVTVSHRTWEATRDTCRYREPRLVTLKGIGEVPVYDLDMG
ncbi:MAG TPA: adenylate/guanylate cyclase domain-containing protein [Novosphingobium sp.]|nr:adenylate/guanylate cyclase domain-containing protein [Novosphingobium sp.]